MNDIIRRLRDATQAVGETIDHAPTLNAGESRTRRAWLVPVAAAASVAVAVAGGAVIAKGGGNGISLVAATNAGAVAAPKFVADASGHGIKIRSVDGGMVTASVAEPSDRERFAMIQAAQDNRLFYATSVTDDCHSRFYQLMLDDDGKIGSFGVLPFTPPEGTMPTSLAVSGDGSKIAYAVESCDVPGGNSTGGKGVAGNGAGGGVAGGDDARAAGQLVVTETATGDSRTWKSMGDFGVSDISISADGRYVAFRRHAGVTVSETHVEPTPLSSAEAAFTLTPTPSASASVGGADPLLTVPAEPAPTVSTGAEPADRVSPKPSETVNPEPGPTDTASPEQVPSASASVTQTHALAEASAEGGPGSPPPTVDPSTGAVLDLEPAVPAGVQCAVYGGGQGPVTIYSGQPAEAVPGGQIVETGPSGQPVPGRQVVEAVPSGQAVDAVPAEPPTPAPSTAPSLPPTAAVGSLTICTDSPEVSLLDTAASGDSLDQARVLTLPTSYDGVSGSVTGVRISPDGTRLIASLMSIGSLIADEKGRQKPVEGSSGLVAYGTGDGKPIEVLYRDDAGNGEMELLDLDGTGRNLMVRTAGEIGAVVDAKYRTLFKEEHSLPFSSSMIVW